MTVRHPPAYVVGQTYVAVVAARQGGHIDRLPTVIVCIGVCPVWIIAGMESPGAIEQSSCAAQRRRIRRAAAPQNSSSGTRTLDLKSPSRRGRQPASNGSSVTDSRIGHV